MKKREWIWIVGAIVLALVICFAGVLWITLPNKPAQPTIDNLVALPAPSAGTLVEWYAEGQSFRGGDFDGCDLVWDATLIIDVSGCTHWYEVEDLEPLYEEHLERNLGWTSDYGGQWDMTQRTAGPFGPLPPSSAGHAEPWMWYRQGYGHGNSWAVFACLSDLAGKERYSIDDFLHGPPPKIYLWLKLSARATGFRDKGVWPLARQPTYPAPVMPPTSAPTTRP